MNEKHFFIYLGNKYKDGLRVHFVKEKGKIIDLMLQYETFLDSKWVAVVRYDCAHGFFHRDIIDPDNSQKKKVFEIFDLSSAFTFARQDIEDKWEWYKEQYLNKIKHE